MKAVPVFFLLCLAKGIDNMPAMPMPMHMPMPMPANPTTVQRYMNDVQNYKNAIPSANRVRIPSAPANTGHIVIKNPPILPGTRTTTTTTPVKICNPGSTNVLSYESTVIYVRETSNTGEKAIGTEKDTTEACSDTSDAFTMTQCNTAELPINDRNADARAAESVLIYEITDDKNEDSNGVGKGENVRITDEDENATTNARDRETINIEDNTNTGSACTGKARDEMTHDTGTSENNKSTGQCEDANNRDEDKKVTTNSTDKETISTENYTSTGGVSSGKTINEFTDDKIEDANGTAKGENIKSTDEDTDKKDEHENETTNATENATDSSAGKDKDSRKDSEDRRARRKELAATKAQKRKEDQLKRKEERLNRRNGK